MESVQNVVLIDRLAVLEGGDKLGACQQSLSTKS